ncbi:hypothetical protein AB0K18_31480 [Nonomuraea sp. NPDC049421]|uniref:hypothetical protein n=1 Tax=Nonomuraea sp. NPDC049421 TaxID=3155275 RepID=UPI00342D8DF2
MIAGLITFGVTRGAVRKAGGRAGGRARWGFRRRAWVLPCLVAGWSLVGVFVRESLLAEPWSTAWVSEYAADLTAALVAAPAQVAVPPMLLAALSVAVQKALPAPAGEVSAPHPVRTDRRWSLVVAGFAVALTYFCVAVRSRGWSSRCPVPGPWAGPTPDGSVRCWPIPWRRTWRRRCAHSCPRDRTPGRSPPTTTACW